MSRNDDEAIPGEQARANTAPDVTTDTAHGTQPGRLPGELDKAAFAHMLALYAATYSHDHECGDERRLHQMVGAVGLYAALTGTKPGAVNAALLAAAQDEDRSSSAAADQATP